MPRVTLYIRDDLKARMDEVGEAANWSSIAQRAFREVVAIHLVRRDSTNMTNVIERLRASKERVDARDAEAGKGSGAKWAKEVAEYDELQRVAELQNFDGIGSELDALQSAIDPEGETDQREWMEFWERLGHRTVTNAVARGFIEGAAEVYEEVSCQL